jgi:hypothetical protein
MEEKESERERTTSLFNGASGGPSRIVARVGLTNGRRATQCSAMMVVVPVVIVVFERVE